MTGITQRSGKMSLAFLQRLKIPDENWGVFFCQNIKLGLLIIKVNKSLQRNKASIQEVGPKILVFNFPIPIPNSIPLF